MYFLFHSNLQLLSLNIFSQTCLTNPILMPQLLISLYKQQKIQLLTNKMFSSSLTSNTQTNLIEKHHGLNLATLSCHKLENSAIYSKYSKDQLHYVVDAVQKGRELPTQVGLKRLIKKNRLRAAKKKLKATNSIPELNPQAPEEICVKALRTEFRNELQKNHIAAQPQPKQKTAAIIKRKQHQRARRNELVRLVKKYTKQLLPHFGNRLQGYGRCPKVSRQQIKDYLKTLGIEAKLDPVGIRPPEERDERRGRGGRDNRYARMPRGMPRHPIVGQQPRLPPIGMNPMFQMMENMRKGIVPPGYPQMGFPPMPPGVPRMGEPWPAVNPLGVPNVPPQPVVQHTPPVLKDEDFPTLL